jgi:hypothetical protein
MLLSWYLHLRRRLVSLPLVPLGPGPFGLNHS